MEGSEVDEMHQSPSILLCKNQNITILIYQVVRYKGRTTADMDGVKIKLEKIDDGYHDSSSYGGTIPATMTTSQMIKNETMDTNIYEAQNPHINSSTLLNIHRHLGMKYRRARTPPGTNAHSKPTCVNCKESFNTHKEFISHKLGYLNCSKYCYICRSEIKHVTMATHLEEFHPLTAKCLDKLKRTLHKHVTDNVTCRLCDISFSHDQDMERHFGSASHIDKMKVAEDVYICKSCQQTFTEQDAYAMHMLSVAQNGTCKNIKSELQQTVHIKPLDKIQNPTSKANTKYEKEAAKPNMSNNEQAAKIKQALVFAIQQRNDTNKTPECVPRVGTSICMYCGKQVPIQESVEHNKVCKTLYTVKASMQQQHKNQTLNTAVNAAYVCTVCKQSFSCKDSLAMHVLMHVKQEVDASKAARDSSTSGKYGKQMLKHVYNIQRYRCRKCSQAFGTQDELAMHMMSQANDPLHNGEQSSPGAKLTRSSGKQSLQRTSLNSPVLVPKTSLNSSIQPQGSTGQVGWRASLVLHKSNSQFPPSHPILPKEQPMNEHKHIDHTRECHSEGNIDTSQPTAAAIKRKAHSLDCDAPPTKQIKSIEQGLNDLRPSSVSNTPQSPIFKHGTNFMGLICYLCGTQFRDYQKLRDHIYRGQPCTPASDNQGLTERPRSNQSGATLYSNQSNHDDTPLSGSLILEPVDLTKTDTSEELEHVRLALDEYMKRQNDNATDPITKTRIKTEKVETHIDNNSNHAKNVQIASKDNSGEKDDVLQFVLSNQDSLHMCPHCKIIFVDQTIFQLHMGLHNHNKPWQCNICGTLTSGVHEFACHVVHLKK
ncbi:unnamed protein product [Owenia fusiformis]|uniref:C2H2-type domain-containing protein n=1 Tax=Owenia fusiformis TaxID=6347 RepID=A0A8S4NXH9_OWEFU|nr:unnamed protein product [Owenia fusiformis]